MCIIENKNFLYFCVFIREGNEDLEGQGYLYLKILYIEYM